MHQKTKMKEAEKKQEQQIKSDGGRFYAETRLALCWKAAGWTGRVATANE